MSLVTQVSHWGFFGRPASLWLEAPFLRTAFSFSVDADFSEHVWQSKPVALDSFGQRWGQGEREGRKVDTARRGWVSELLITPCQLDDFGQVTLLACASVSSSRKWG